MDTSARRLEMFYDPAHSPVSEIDMCTIPCFKILGPGLSPLITSAKFLQVCALGIVDNWISVIMREVRIRHGYLRAASWVVEVLRSWA
jgi:hypothetical protein